MWEKVEPSGVEDETINNVFYTNGIFKILNEEEPSAEPPNVIAFVQNGMAVVAIENCLALLSVESVAECTSFHMESRVECLTLSESGNVIVCGLSDGTLHGIHISGVSLFCLDLFPEDTFESNNFVAIHLLNSAFFVLTRCSKVYKIHNIDESLLNQSLLEQSGNGTLLTSVVGERVANVKRAGASCLLPVQINSTETLVITSAGKEIFFHSENYSVQVSVSCPLKALFDLDSYILGLSEDGNFSLICPFTKLVTPLKSSIPVDTMMVVASNSDEIELLIVTRPEEDGDRVLKILDFPSMKCKNELILQGPSIWLVQQPKQSVNMYFMHGSKNESGHFSEVEMRLVNEIDPLDRLKKLIRRGHFDEAEEFARQFELSLQPVYEAKARVLCQQIRMRDEPEEKFEELLNLLNIIESKQYFISLVHFEAKNRQTQEKFFLFLKGKLDPVIDLKFVRIVNEKLLRMETLRLIDRSESYSQWQDFLNHRSLKDFCLKTFKTDFPAACLIWSRHTYSILPYLEESHVLKVLDSIPSNVEPIDIIHWLKHFLPSALQTHPKTMVPLVEWCISKTKSFQFSSHWPNIGLEFMTKISQIFHDITFIQSNIRGKFELQLELIANTIISLEDLMVLKRSYNLTIPLEEYTKDSFENTAYSILQRVQMSNLRALVKDFLCPIFQEKGLRSDPVILRYIKFLSVSKNYTDWPERVIAALELLHNEDDRYQAVLLAVQAAPIPWPEKLNPLLKYAQSSHFLAHEIYVEYQHQTIKALRSKYGWPVNHVEQCGDRVLFVRRILLKNLPEMLEDVKTVVKASPGDATEANFYVVKQLIDRREEERALKYLDELPEEERERSCDRVIGVFLRLIDDGDVVAEVLDVIKAINRRRNGTFDFEIREIEKVLKIRSVFGFTSKVSVSNLHEMNLQILAIQNLIESVKADDKTVMNTIFSKIVILASIFDLQPLEVGLKTATFVGNLNFTMSFIMLALNGFEVTRQNVKFVVRLALLALQQKIEMPEKEAVSKMFFPILHVWLQKAVAKGDLYAVEVREMIQWTSVGRQLSSMLEIEECLRHPLSTFEVTPDMLRRQHKTSESSNSASKRDSLSVFNSVEAPTRPDQLCNTDSDVAVECLSTALHLVAVSNPPQNSFVREIAVSQSSEDDISVDLISLLQKLIKTKKHVFAFLTLQLIRKYERETESELIINDVRKQLMFEILKTATKADKLNVLESLNILNSFPNPFDTLQYLQNTAKSDEHKLNCMELAEMFYSTRKMKDKEAEARKCRKELKYRQELCNIDQSFKFKTTLNFASADILFRELKGKQIKVELVQKMSRDFDWDYDEALSAQIISILASQNLDFEVTTDLFGKEEIVMKTSVEELWKACEPYVKEVENHSKVADKLRSSVSLFNVYFYELYLCVVRVLLYFDAMSDRMKMWERILMLLLTMSRKRKKIPGQFEKDWWLKLVPDNGVLPRISKYRMPFLLLVQEPLKLVLDDELNVENVEYWLPLVELITILKKEDLLEQKDYFCMVSVKNSEGEMRASMAEKPTAEWLVNPINSAFLDSVCRITNLMHDKSKVLFLLYFVTNHAPEGIDQVQAAEKCFIYATSHEQELSQHSKAKEVVIKIKRKYPIFKIQHLLVTYGLADEKLMQLVENPEALLRALYFHESIVKDQRLDINGFVNEIAGYFGMDAESVQIGLLEKWLNFKMPSDLKGIESMMEDTMLLSVNDGEISEENCKRAYYILKSWDLEKATSFLALQILNNDVNGSSGNQLQLIECFTKLLNDDRANSIYDDLINQDHYNVLKCLNHLRQLGYKFEVEKFKAADKLGILKNIWTKHGTESRGVELLVFICLTFDIMEPQVWNGILNQLVKLNLDKLLASLIHVLSARPELLHVQGLVNAWMAVIKAPLKASKNHLHNPDRLVNALILLQSCPVSSDLDFPGLTDVCLHIEQPHLAAVFLAFIKDPEKFRIVKEALKPHVTPKFVVALEELKEHGVNPSAVNFAITEFK